MNEKNLSRDSSPDAKTYAKQAVYESIGDFFFDKVNFITLNFAQVNDAGSTTDQTNYATDNRIIDTSEGRFMDLDKESRFRTHFYLENAANADAYILSPALLDGFTLGNVTSMESTFRSYVGIRILNNKVSVVVKEYGKDEVNYPVDFKPEQVVSFTTTYPLEIKYRINYTDIYIDNELVGSYPTDLGAGQQTVTFYPLFAPAKSTDGSSVNLVLESSQFIQSR